MRLEPRRHVQDRHEEHLVHRDLVLNVQVATLAQDGERKPIREGLLFVIRQVVHGEDMTTGSVMWMSTTFAFPSRFFFQLPGELRPAFGILI